MMPFRNLFMAQPSYYYKTSIFQKNNYKINNNNDDLTLGGEQSAVAKDVERVAEIGQAMGLTLNVSKCELITESGTVVCHLILQSFKSVPV